MKPQDNEAEPAGDDTPDPAPDVPAERDRVDPPATENELQAETEVTEVTREVLRELEQRKTRIEGREQAQALIDDILGAESRISRAEIVREERFRPRFERQRPGEERMIEVTPDQRREATTYFQIVAALAEAMKQMPEEERFVIEGHASAEGSYDSNLTLSQQRAETIVRDMVRRGVSAYGLLPVGYGESEARHPAEAAEALRSQDRRVVVFRMQPEPIAQR